MLFGPGVNLTSLSPPWCLVCACVCVHAARFMSCEPLNRPEFKSTRKASRDRAPAAKPSTKGHACTPARDAALMKHDEGAAATAAAATAAATARRPRRSRTQLEARESGMYGSDRSATHLRPATIDYVGEAASQQEVLRFLPKHSQSRHHGQHTGHCQGDRLSRPVPGRYSVLCAVPCDMEAAGPGPGRRRRSV